MLKKTKEKTLKRTGTVMVNLIWSENGLPSGDVSVAAYADEEGWGYGAIIKKAELEAMGGLGSIRSDEYAEAARKKLEAEGFSIVEGIWGFTSSDGEG